MTALLAAAQGGHETGAAPRARPERLYVADLKLTDFRNYARAHLKLDDRPVLLVGDNGAGKTNLLEAVSLLGAGQGLRGRPYVELVRNGAPSCAIAARVMSRHGEVELGTGYTAAHESGSSGRTVRISGKEQSAGALADYVSVLWLVPAMDGLFTGGASERRRFLDRLVLAIDPRMRGPLGRYERAMRQRNRLFQLREGSRALFVGLETEMAEAATAIAASRLDAVARLSALIDSTRQARGDSSFPWAVISVEGTLEAALRMQPATEVEDDYRARLDRDRERDRAAARAFEGPHLSDLAVVHGPKNAPAAVCSSGEQKALLIGLILAKAELVKMLQGIPPLILLDEIAAHLDAARREALFGEILRLESQAWMTGTDVALFAAIAQDAQILAVNQGIIGG